MKLKKLSKDFVENLETVYENFPGLNIDDYIVFLYVSYMLEHSNETSIEDGVKHVAIYYNSSCEHLKCQKNTFKNSLEILVEAGLLGVVKKSKPLRNYYTVLKDPIT